MKRGFTIVELLVVVAVIGVLGGIVTTTAAGALKSARTRRADAMCTVLEQGIATFYAQEGEWPRVIQSRSENMDADTYTLTDSEADEVFQEVVGRCYGKNGKKSVLMDTTGLFVARRSALGNGGKGCNDNHKVRQASNYCGNLGCIAGVDFTTAIAKSGRDHIRLTDMAFGYQGTEEGKFRRYKITYNGKADTVSVSK